MALKFNKTAVEPGEITHKPARIAVTEGLVQLCETQRCAYIVVSGHQGTY